MISEWNLSRHLNERYDEMPEPRSSGNLLGANGRPYAQNTLGHFRRFRRASMRQHRSQDHVFAGIAGCSFERLDLSGKVEARVLDNLFQPMHLLVILFIALLVFGPKKLPELGKGLGEGIRSFKESLNGTPDKPEEKEPVEK